MVLSGNLIQVLKVQLSGDEIVALTRNPTLRCGN